MDSQFQAIPNLSPDLRFIHAVPLKSYAKSWYKPSTWAALAQVLNQAGYVCYVSWGNAEERLNAAEIIEAVDHECTRLLPYTALNDWPALLNLSALVIGVDTGLLHLANVMRIPCVGLFINETSTLFPFSWALSIERKVVPNNDEPTPNEVFERLKKLPLAHKV